MRLTKLRQKATKAWTSKALLEKGMYNHIRAQIVLANFPCRFGWVNASYILGYELMDIQMRRAIDLTVHTRSVGFNGFNLKE